MSDRSLDVVARRAAAVFSGRRSLMRLGGMALAAGITNQSIAETQGKRKGKRKKKNPCFAETERCREVAQGLNVSAEAKDQIIACCGCDVPTVIACLATSSGEMRP